MNKHNSVTLNGVTFHFNNNNLVVATTPADVAIAVARLSEAKKKVHP